MGMISDLPGGPGNKQPCEHCGAAGEEPCAPGCPNEEVSCEYCGARSTEPHEPGCELDTPEDPRDPDRAYDARHESVSHDFDKFMDSTLLKETRQATHDVKKVSPQRQLARNYQEHPLGKIRFGGPRGR